MPQFVGVSYIDLSAIEAISRFRSAEGHAYVDGFESCRSMKHYLRPRADVVAAAIPILAPATGAVAFVRDDLWGRQIGIRPADQPAFTIVLFHVEVTAEPVVGLAVTAGERLGSHVGSQTWSDVAVGVDAPDGYRLVSWFEVIPDDLVREFQARGLASRDDAIIGRVARDADPLACDQGGQFSSRGHLPGWADPRPPVP